MKTQSLQFLKNLQQNIEDIKLDLLGEYIKAANDSNDPDPFMSTPINSKKDIITLNNRIRSFYLVVHAEIQGYLEYLSKGYLSKAYKEYVENNRITKLLLFFSTYGHPNIPTGENFSKESNNKYIYDFGSFEERYNVMYNSYSKVIKDNNGVKLRDCVKLFYPLGLSLNELEKFKCVVLLESFGEKRGNFAHNPYHEVFKGNKMVTTVTDVDNEIKLILDSFEKELIPRLNQLIE